MVFEMLESQALAPTACTTIEEVGSTGVGALTIAFLILGISTIIFIARVNSATVQKQFYYANIFICGLSTLAYFAMLSGQGWTAIAGCRQFFYARYFAWFLSSPLIVLTLGLIAGAEFSTIAAAIGAISEIFINIFSICTKSVAASIFFIFSRPDLFEYLVFQWFQSSQDTWGRLQW